MRNTVRVDIHSHVYPEKVAARAAASVGEFYHIQMHGPGTVAGLLDAQERGKIDYSLVHSVALKADQVTTINDFIAQQVAQHPSLIGFATMHQDFEDPAAEIDRALAMGLEGFKLHPDSQGVNIDDERLMRFYECLEGRAPLMVHCGDYRYDNSHPRRTKHVLQSFPNLVVDCAHFGGWSIYDLAIEYLEEENCFMDLSSAAVYLGPRRTTELIHLYGAERILFGSDYPMWDPAEEVERFFLNNLTAAEQEQVLWHTAEAYLGRELVKRS